MTVRDLDTPPVRAAPTGSVLFGVEPGDSAPSAAAFSALLGALLAFEGCVFGSLFPTGEVTDAHLTTWPFE